MLLNQEHLLVTVEDEAVRSRLFLSSLFLLFGLSLEIMFVAHFKFVVKFVIYSFIWSLYYALNFFLCCK